MLNKLRKSMKNEKGFTLIELMIVVAIIGSLAAIAIPNFLNYQKKAKQSEAKVNLGAIRTLAEAYRAEHDTYLPAGATVPYDPVVLGFEVKGTARYTYSVTVATATTFTVTATGTATGIAGDVWTIDQDGTLTDVVPGSFTS